MATTRIPFQWGNANFAWETNPFPNQSKNPFTWDDVALIITVLEGLGGGGKPEDQFKDKEKRKKFITLIMKCEAMNKEYKETKEVKNRQIRITDIALVAKEVLGINIKIDL
jgi:spermidine/putrescine-binding protein